MIPERAVSGATAAPPARAADSESFVQQARRDPILVGSLAAFVAVLAPYAVYLGGGSLGVGYRDDLSFALLAAVVAFASFAGVGAARSRSERRFRTLIGASFSLWAAIELLELVFGKTAAGGNFAPLDSLFVVYYVLFGFAALDDRRLGEAAETRLLRALRRAETAVFACGVFVYFVVLPSQLDPDSFASYLPSAFLYVALDGYLLALFARRLLRAESAAEKTRWRLVTLSGALFLVSDALFFFDVSGAFDASLYPLVDFVWFVPHLALIFALRMPGTGERTSGEVDLGERELPPAPFAPSFLYAALVPLIHLVAATIGVASGPAAQAQRAWALALTVLLGGLAAYHQRRIVNTHLALRRELLESRQRLGAARKLEAIGHLAAGVAHDFNNLLTVVVGRAELLLGRTTDPAAQRDLELVIRSAGRAADLTQELLAVGQRGMGVTRRIDVAELLESIRGELVELCGARVELVCEREDALTPLVVEIDPAHLERVFRNLASNARDAMADGGRLTILTRLRRIDVERPAPWLELARGAYASIVFEDTGAGMDEATLQHLFEPFFTTKTLGRGTGLGLATAYGLVRQHGGGIAASNRLNRGARFEVLLPLASGTPAAPSGG